MLTTTEIENLRKNLFQRERDVTFLQNELTKHTSYRDLAQQAVQRQRERVAHLETDGNALLDITDADLELEKAKLRELLRDAARKANDCDAFVAKYPNLAGDHAQLQAEQEALEWETAVVKHRELVMALLDSKLRDAAGADAALHRHEAMMVSRWPKKKVQLCAFVPGCFIPAPGDVRPLDWQTLWNTFRLRLCLCDETQDLIPAGDEIRQRVEPMRDHLRHEAWPKRELWY